MAISNRLTKAKKTESRNKRKDVLQDIVNSASSIVTSDASDARVENRSPGNCTRWRLVGGRAGGIKERGNKKDGRKSSEAARGCAMKRRGRAAFASQGGGREWNLKDAAGRSGRENLPRNG